MIKLEDIIKKYKQIKTKQRALNNNEQIDFDSTQDNSNDDNTIDEVIDDCREIEGKNLKMFFSACFPEVYKVFQEIEYEPMKLDEANAVFLSYLDLDKTNEMKVSFAKSFLYPDKKTTIKINKNNFYVGYHTKVWSALSLQQRAQIVKWHLNYKKEQLKSKDIDLRLIISKDNTDDYEMCGMYEASKKYLYINPTFLFKEDSIRLEHTIEHEFEHIKQRMLINYLDKTKPEKMNLYEKYIHDRFNDNYMYIENATLSQVDALYFADPSELVAEHRGLKNIEKYMKDPLYKNLFNTIEKTKFEHYKAQVYYKDFVYTPNQVRTHLGLSEKEIEQYKKDRKFVKQMPNIVKLILLRDKVISKKIDKLNETYYQYESEVSLINKKQFDMYPKNDDKLKQEKKEYKDKMKQVKNSIKELESRISIINNFLQDIINDKTPKLSDDFFCELNLMEK